jgi:hypothetical protein
MGRVICEKHGASGGPLCCDHVLAAVYGREPRVQYRNVKFDAVGDGSCIVQHLICTDCLGKHGLETVDEVTEEVWEDENRFPRTCPVCEGCLAEYTKIS